MSKRGGQHEGTLQPRAQEQLADNPRFQVFDMDDDAGGEFGRGVCVAKQQSPLICGLCLNWRPPSSCGTSLPRFSFRGERRFRAYFVLLPQFLGNQFPKYPPSLRVRKSLQNLPHEGLIPDLAVK